MKTVLIPVIANLGVDHRCRKIVCSLEKYGYSADVYCDKPYTEYKSMWKGVKLSIITKKSHRDSFFPVFFVFNLKFCFKLLFSGAEFCIVEDCPPLLTSALIGRIRGIRVIYDSRELFTETPGVKKSFLNRTFWSLWEYFGIKLCHGVITVSDEIKRRLSEKYSVKRLAVIPNMPLKRRGSINDIGNLSDSGAFKLLYQGELRNGSGLYETFQALLKFSSLEIDIYGSGEQKGFLQKQVDSMKLNKRIRFKGVLEYSKLAQRTPEYHIGIHMLHPLTESFNYTLSNKIFEYIQAGLPVLLSNTDAHTDLVSKYDIGVIAPYDDPSMISSALKRLINSYDYYYRNVIKYRNEFIWENHETLMIDLLNRE